MVKFKPTLSLQTLATLQAACLSTQPTALRIGNLDISSATLLSLTPNTLGKRTKTLQASRLRDIDRIAVLRLPNSVSALDVERLLRDFSRHPDVEYATPVRLLSLDSDASPPPASAFSPQSLPNSSSHWRTPNDSAYRSQWNLAKIQAEAAWQLTKGDSAVLIGIIDTGIDYTHPDLAPKLFIKPAEDRNRNGTFEPWDFRERRNPQTFELDPNGLTGDFDGIDQDGNGYPDDVIGWDFTDQPFNNDALNGSSDFQFPDPDPFDDNSHGTACAGIAAAATNNRIGIAGVAPNCRLVALRVFTGAGGYGGDAASDKDIASALIYAADNGIRVVNMSFGDVVASPVLRDAVKYAYSKGVVMCASAGNAGGEQQRYPAGYDEVIATAATTRFDEITPFSTRGFRVDFAAPGEAIPTTYPFYRNFYSASFGGTSAAAAHASGAAALVLSRNPSLSPEQVRGILVATADDIEDEGWDHSSGGGRLNLLRAIEALGAPIAKILSPTYDSGIFPNNFASSRVPIIGTALSPQFQDYALQFRPGLSDRAAWQTIQPPTARQRLQDTLGFWNVAALPDSVYVVRLLVREQNGRTIENRIQYFLDRTPPRLDGVRYDEVIINDQYGILIEAETDDLSEATLFFKRHGTREPFQPFRLPFIRRRHFVLLRRTELQPDVEYEWYLQVRNVAGLSTESERKRFRLRGEIFQPPTFGQTLFRERREFRLPTGTLLPLVQDFNRNGRREVLLNEALPLQGARFSRLKRFEFTGERFELLDSVASPVMIPQHVGDLNRDGLLETVAYAIGRSIIFSQSSPTSSPFARILFQDTTSRNFWASRIADTKGTGEQHLLVRNDTAYFILDSTFRRLATLPNPVRRAKDGTRPQFEQPKSIVEDFDGDGKPEILVGDFDGNFYIYEYSGVGNIYTQTWLNRTPYLGGSNFIVSGNFLGNGQRQFVVMAHADLNFDTQTRDYAAPVWLAECWQAVGNDRYEKIWSQRFFNYRAKSLFESAIQSGDLDRDGIDELCILAYPNLYVFKWNASHQRFEPFWIFPAATAQELLIADIDGNGRNEIFFSDDLQTFGYEFQGNTLPPSPVGVSVEPLDETALQLSWNRTPEAQEYRIYRGEYLSFPSYPFVLSRRATVTENVFIDRAVQRNRFYVYAVTAFDGVRESDTSVYVLSVPKPLPRLLSAEYDADDHLRLRFSDALQDAPLNPAWFEIQKQGGLSFYPTSAILARGAREVVLSFRNAPLDTGRYEVRVSPNVRDIFNARLDAQFRTASFDVRQVPSSAFFVLSRRALAPDQVELTMSKPIDAVSAQSLSNYEVRPSGRVSSVEVDNRENRLRLRLEGRRIGALGVPVSITLRRLRAADGTPIDTASSGNVVVFSEVKDDLSSVFTYPNPYHQRAGVDFVMFANLTRKATIEILTLTGRVIKRIEHSGETGGARWFLDTEQGEKVSSGIYLYRITAEGVPEKVGKLAVVR
ncbi:MAG: S8 family serine peptidase [Chloroherpetonaceae bacterium]|nr:S8 family serine peptidase [Chloroherpetonaceae bacterium]